MGEIHKTLGGDRLGAENKMPKVEINTPNSSNFNLSKINRFSCGMGGLYPAYIKNAQDGDTWHINTQSLIKTMPTIGPVFGSCKMQLDFFFIPTRIYHKHLHNDRLKFKPEQIYYPRMKVQGITGRNGATLTVKGNELNKRQVHPSSLLHRIGISGLGTAQDGTNNVVTRSFNAIPVLGYADIFKNYYANTQENDAYVIGGTIDGKAKLVKFALKEIDDIRDALMAQSSGAAYQLTIASPEPYRTMIGYINNTVGSTEKTAGMGILVKTYMADRFNAWLSTEQLEQLANNRRIPVYVGATGTQQGNYMTIDNLRIQNKMSQMVEKTLVSGGRYSDWLLVQFGNKVDIISEIPTYIGGASGELTFDEVTSSVGTAEEPLGSMAGKGYGRWTNNSVTYHVKEEGYIMGIFSITPRIDYSMGNKAMYRRITLADEHIPELDSIGFEDLITEDMVAFDTSVTSSTDSSSTSHYAIGKQMMWTDWMTDVNEAHGTFAIENDTMWMTFNRKYEANEITGRWADASSYIDPTKHNNIFADQSLEGENFWIQLGLDIKVSRKMSKKVMPSL